jgi:hypothetical protein
LNERGNLTGEYEGGGECAAGRFLEICT